MKKIFLLTVLSLIHLNTANAATPWWLQPTVCRLDPTNCYTAMGAGFDSALWDTTSNCWGLKLICPQALTTGADAPVAMERNDIRKGKNIKPDYDTDSLAQNAECFGRRKFGKNGSTISVNGKYVNVYCHGILSNPDETFENGDIVHNVQPTCETLAKSGYIAVENNGCFGKYYDSSDYFIECGNALLPERLIVLNGADYNATASNAPKDMSAANKKFEEMYNTSKRQHDRYFSE